MTLLRHLDHITMGGMFTILKVRPELPSGYAVDSGWYQQTAGALAALVGAEDLERDGIDLPKS